jgi:hypothetical protein
MVDLYEKKPHAWLRVPQTLLPHKGPSMPTRLTTCLAESPPDSLATQGPVHSQPPPRATTFRLASPPCRAHWIGVGLLPPHVGTRGGGADGWRPCACPAPSDVPCPLHFIVPTICLLHPSQFHQTPSLLSSSFDILVFNLAIASPGTRYPSITTCSCTTFASAWAGFWMAIRSGCPAQFHTT